jgi:uncharacterized RDD family membrane protein YckC
MPNSRTTTGLPPGVFAGPTGPRLLAALVEVGPVWLLVGLALLFALVWNGSVLVVVLCLVVALAWGALIWAQRAARAAGPGMRLQRLQVVGLSDGRPLGWGRVLLRWLVFAGLTVTVVGLVAMLIVLTRHPRRQGWHDLAANAVVIKERPLAPPRSKAAVARTARPKTGATGSASPAAKTSSRPPGAADKPATKTTTQPTPVSGAAGESTEAEETVVVAETEGGQGSAATGAAAVAATTDQSQATDGDDRDGSSEVESSDAGGESEEPALAEWMLRLDDGRNVAVEGLVLLGRNPQPRVGEEDATLIKVSDETRTVSKSHLAVGVDVTGLYVMDRGSTNGTMVTAPDGGQRPCPPGDLVDVPGGSVISFGDHWLEVYRPDRGH